MSQQYVTRGELIQRLQQWQRKELSTQQLWDWASHRFSDEIDYDDDEEGWSAVHEILSMLDSLDMHLSIAEDVPIHLAFLETPIGSFADGYCLWREALDALDLSARRRRLKDDPIYGPFCQ